MPVIPVKIQADSKGQVQLFDGRMITIQEYHALVAAQHGEENVPWDNEQQTSFMLYISTPMPFSGTELEPKNILNGPDFTKVTITDETLQRMADDPDWIHIVCMVVRPGIYLFMRTLELEHYRPCTPRNNLFYMVTMKWQDMDWIIVSVPSKDRSIVDAVAKDCGMKLADGIPHIFGGNNGEPAIFPMNSPRVFSLSNSADSIVYNGIAAAEMTRELEMKAVDKLERKHSEWMQKQGL